MESTGTTPTPSVVVRARRRHSMLTLGVVAVGLVLAVTFWPAISGSGSRGLRELQPLWLIPAVALASLSMLTAALQQRRVLRAGGLDLPVRSMMAITVAGNAVSVTLPLAGSTAGTAFTYLQLKRRGADLALAGWALVMSGIISSSVLALLLGLGANLTSDSTASTLGAGAILLGVVPIALIVASLRWPQVQAAVSHVASAAISTFQRATGRGAKLHPDFVAEAFERVSGFRLGWRAGASAAALSVVNWLTDVACLAVCITALGADVPWTHLALVYAAALGAASISFTPAGIGIVETAVAVSLMEFGTPAHLAVVAALMYRAVSCWLVLASGWITYLVLRRRPSNDAAAGVPLAAI